MKVFRTTGNRNRAYVIDNKGNKLYYGTLYQCDKFKKYMEGEKKNEERKSGLCAVGRRKDRD